MRPRSRKWRIEESHAPCPGTTRASASAISLRRSGYRGARVEFFQRLLHAANVARVVVGYGDGGGGHDCLLHMGVWIPAFAGMTGIVVGTLAGDYLHWQAAVFVAGEHEQQVGEAVQVDQDLRVGQHTLVSQFDYSALGGPGLRPGDVYGGGSGGSARDYEVWAAVLSLR